MTASGALPRFAWSASGKAGHEVGIFWGGGVWSV